MNDFSVVLILFLFVYNFTSSFNFDSVLYILSTKVRLYCCHLMRVCDFRTHSRQVTVCLAESCVLFYALFWKLKFATLKYTCGEKVFGVRGQINFCRGQCELCISPSIKLSWIHDETSFENCFLFFRIPCRWPGTSSIVLVETRSFRLLAQGDWPTGGRLA